jgi:dTDP-4-dehydrorhamnose reductase
MMKIAITGASGKIASALLEAYRTRRDVELLLLSSKPVTFGECLCTVHVENVAPHETERYKQTLKTFRPDAIINTIGYTDVDGCETNRALAQLLNAQFPEMLARYARTFDVHLVHYSTDYVFDGTAGPYDEAQLPNPINYYGKTKLAGENAIRSLGCRHTIIRTNVVYGFGGSAKSDFVEWVIRSCSANLPIFVATDQLSNPTFSGDIAWATIAFLDKGKMGLFHVGGADYCSRYDFARAIAQAFDVRDDLITPIATAELGQKAPRPLRAGLVSLKAEVILGRRFSGIAEGLALYRRHYRNKGKG